MVKITDTVTASDRQWEIVTLGCRNAFNSWDRSDSYWDTASGRYCIGEADLELMKKLCMAGSSHRKFMRMLPVYCNITAPLYFWKQLDKYKVGSTDNSGSTMHCIHKCDVAEEDFSSENMDEGTYEIFNAVLQEINRCRKLYNETKNKKYWNSMIKLMPDSYNQRKTWNGNYEILKSIYHDRKGHKLAEWQMFREWIESLPYSKLITGGEE